MGVPKPALKKEYEQFVSNRKDGPEGAVQDYQAVVGRFSRVDSIAELVEAMAQEPASGSQREVRDATHFAGTALCYGIEGGEPRLYIVNDLDVIFPNSVPSGMLASNYGAQAIAYADLDNPSGLRLQTIHPWLHGKGPAKVDRSCDTGQTVLKVSIPELAAFDEGRPYFNAAQRSFLTALYGNPVLMGEILMQETSAGRENMSPEQANKGRVTWISLPSPSRIEEHLGSPDRLLVVPAWMNNTSGACGIEAYSPTWGRPEGYQLLNTGVVRGQPLVQRVDK